MDDFDNVSQDATNLIVENVIKSVIFNGKVADDMIFIPQTKIFGCPDEENNATITTEDTQISLEHQRSSKGDISDICFLTWSN